jgi:uncharacterized protein YtpQ (UPF0354 family)
MVSRFVNLFKRDDHDEQRSFQRLVYSIASGLYEDRIFSICDDPMTLESEGVVFGLTNLLARYQLSDEDASVLEELVKEQFDESIFATRNEAKELDWDEARKLVMPQLVREEILAVAPIELVFRPFVDGVVLAAVIDSESSYEYVNIEGLEKWEIERDVLFEAAFENLHARSQGIEMMAIPGDDAFFIIKAMDGFDAVRLLSTEIRGVISEHIGTPFFAGIPNRDFLICWAATGSDEFKGKLREQVSADFDEQPYPLCRNPLEVSEDGEIRLAAVLISDPRAKNANLN